MLPYRYKVHFEKFISKENLTLEDPNNKEGKAPNSNYLMWHEMFLKL